MIDENIEPVHLVEDEKNGSRFLIYGTNKGLCLDIRYEGDALWMTQAQIAELFGVDRSVITKHIANILAENELDENVVSANFAHTTLHGAISGKTQTRSVKHYNLDMVISVGYRVSSAQATVFRRWATGILVQFATKGFVIDSPRLKRPENFDRIAELREIIRDIRSDEANVYRELKNICAMCQDYDGTIEQSRSFFKKMQAKLIYAVTSHTPAEIIFFRADSKYKNMGLQTWSKDNIRKSDVTISKNYLAEAEIKELNRLTTILLDIFEDQLDLGRILVMQDAADLLDNQLKNLGRSVLTSGGTINAKQAKLKADLEYGKFDEQRKNAQFAEADANIAVLAKEIRKLPKRPKR